MKAAAENRIVYLRGDRIYLRPLEMADLPRCQRWVNEPETRKSLATYKPFSEMAERKFIESASETADKIKLAIVLKRDDRHIGNCGLFNIRWKDRTGEFGITIGEPDCRGQGHGAEATRLMVEYAFDTLNLNRVQLGVLATNPAAIRCYQRVGFVLEGVQRQHVYVNGAYVDHAVYAILRGEYSKPGMPRSARGPGLRRHRT